MLIEGSWVVNGRIERWLRVGWDDVRTVRCGSGLGVWVLADTGAGPLSVFGPAQVIGTDTGRSSAARTGEVTGQITNDMGSNQKSPETRVSVD